MSQALSIPAADFSPLKLLNAGDRTALIGYGLALSPSALMGSFGFVAKDAVTRRHLMEATVDRLLSTSGIQVFGCYDTRGDRLLMITMLLPDPHEPAVTWELAISSIAAEMSEALWHSAYAHALQCAMDAGVQRISIVASMRYEAVANVLGEVAERLETREGLTRAYFSVPHELDELVKTLAKFQALAHVSHLDSGLGAVVPWAAD